jgi:hypothetical protein
MIGRTNRRAGLIVFITNAVTSAQSVTPDAPMPSTVLASARLRILIPAKELSKSRFVWLVPLDEFLRDPGLRELRNIDAIVLGKLATKEVAIREAQLRKLFSMIDEGMLRAPLFADISDDYSAFAEQTGQSYLYEFQREIGRRATIVVPSEALADALGPMAAHGLHVIEDPYESAPSTVRVERGSPLRLLWFGQLGHLTYPAFERCLRSLAIGLPNESVIAEIVTSELSRQTVLALDSQISQSHPRFRLTFTPWTLKATEDAMARSNFVVLPQDHDTRFGRVKSHNRLVSAIRGGRLAAASPIPAYCELSNYAWVGEDLLEGLRWAMSHPTDAGARVRAGQVYVGERFSPRTVAQKWARLLGGEVSIQP